MKQHFWYNSPEALTRKEAVKLMVKACEEQMELLIKMRSGDGRTIKMREMTKESNRLEDRIQELLAIVSNPETSEGNLQ